MQRGIAILLTLTFSMIFGVDTPKESATPSESTHSQEIQFDAEAFQKNIRVGQVIQEMGPNVRNLKKIESQRDFEKSLAAYDEGDLVLLLIRRDNDNTFFVALTVPKQ